MTTTRIRRFRDDDAEATAQVFFDSVRQRNAVPSTTKRNGRAWAPAPPDAVRLA